LILPVEDVFGEELLLLLEFDEAAIAAPTTATIRTTKAPMAHKRYRLECLLSSCSFGLLSGEEIDSIGMANDPPASSRCASFKFAATLLSVDTGGMDGTAFGTAMV